MSDLSKAFGCINHPFLIAKIDSFGFSPLSTKIIFSYLSNRTQRTKIKNKFSKRSNILHGVSQGSILGPLLFNVDLINFFSINLTNIHCTNKHRHFAKIKNRLKRYKLKLLPDTNKVSG